MGTIKKSTLERNRRMKADYWIKACDKARHRFDQNTSDWFDILRESWKEGATLTDKQISTLMEFWMKSHVE